MMEGKSAAARSKAPEPAGGARATPRQTGPAPLSLLDFQSAVGNQAVHHLLGGARRRLAAPALLVQRKCRCQDEETLQRSTATAGAEANAPVPEAAPPPAPPQPSPEPAAEEPALEAAPAAPLIVDDDVETVAPGQMTKSEFFARLRSEVCAAAEAGLAGTEHSAQGCPLIEFWIGYYEQQDVERINRDLPRFAGEGPRLETAEGYVALITSRVRESVTVWARTGEVTGVPPGLPLPGMGLPGLGGLGGLAGGLGALGGLSFKARAGGPRLDDPRALSAGLGQGRPLDATLRSRMESAFGRGFSDVRVHTDAEAARLSSGLNARAFTVGRHVAFGPGEFQPGTLIGDALIAHELAHVAQQSGATGLEGPIPSGGHVYDALESDADLAAVGAVASLWGGLRSRIRSLPKAIPQLRSGLRLQRCPSCGTSNAPQRQTTPTVTPASPPPQVAPAQANAACQPTPASYDVIQREGQMAGTLGYTKLDPSSQLICAPRFTPGPTPGTCSFTPRPLSLAFISKHTKKGDHPGGTVPVPNCPNPVPVVYRVSEATERLVIQGEQEHCGDLKVAFDRTLKPCGDALQRLAGTPLIGQDENQCFADLVRKLGFDPIDCTREFLRLQQATDLRDTRDWHTFTPVRIAGDCRQVVFGFDRDPKNKIGDASVAPEKHVPAATGCSGPAAAPAVPPTPPPPAPAPPPAPPGGRTMAKCSCQEVDDEDR